MFARCSEPLVKFVEMVAKKCPASGTGGNNDGTKPDTGGTDNKPDTGGTDNKPDTGANSTKSSTGGKDNKPGTGDTGGSNANLCDQAPKMVFFF